MECIVFNRVLDDPADKKRSTRSSIQVVDDPADKKLSTRSSIKVIGDPVCKKIECTVVNRGARERRRDCFQKTDLQ
ncbi:hypothetical protein AM500_18230 [Bacillus sp. FJAT-18017]|nr:hypothetical protein AM500_18230 [Bacillus sp. FJAT-18017]